MYCTEARWLQVSCIGLHARDPPKLGWSIQRMLSAVHWAGWQARTTQDRRGQPPVFMEP